MRRLASIPVLLALLQFPGAAQTIIQEAYLKASNTGNDDFGWSVALSGDTAVIGARREDSADGAVNGNQANNAAPGAGAAYVFVRSGAGWSQEAYLKASNAEGGAVGTNFDSGDLFGFSVAVSGDTVVVGALREDSGVSGDQNDNSEENAGAAYVFSRNGTTWTQQAYLKADDPDAQDDFGRAVAISGNTIVVGAPGQEPLDPPIGPNRFLNSGAVYVFVWKGTNWFRQAILTPATRGVDDRFGSSVAISGDTIVVGATGEDSIAVGVDGDATDNSVGNSGAAYVFTRSDQVWTQEAYLKASNTGSADAFGASVGIWDDLVVVGASSEDSAASGVNGNQLDNSMESSGAVYVFARSGTTWSQEAYLKASNPDEFDAFGGSVGQAPGVAVADGTIAVAARLESSAATGIDGDQTDNTMIFAGAVYVFSREAGTWTQEAYVKASNTGFADRFHAPAISGDTVLVGAYRERSAATGVDGDQLDDSLGSAGAAYAFILPRPEIAVHDGALATDPELSDGQVAVVEFLPALLGAPTARPFTIANLGPVDLTISSMTAPTGFSVSELPAGPIPPSGLHTFELALDSLSPGNFSGEVVIESDDPDEPRFTFSVSGQLVAPGDGDGDGMDNLPEALLASLGFDPAVPQPDMVADLHAHAHAVGLFSPDQLQTLHLDVPLLFHDPATGKFTLTLGLQKSTGLETFDPFVFTLEDLSIDPAGKLQFEFTNPDPTAFFVVEAE